MGGEGRAPLPCGGDAARRTPLDGPYA
jgi:hypothetical protein